MSKTQITVSSQIQSANTKSEIENHSGKKNRAMRRHKNEDIDISKSHLNVEFDLHNKYDLLEEHYRERIDKHNKNNNSAARRYDSMDEFLESFEGKKVKVGGKLSKNERWSTASQISYFGGKDSLNPVLKELTKAGATQQEIIEAYSTGYESYIYAHNERFPTLPIYHSDVHFDETTPHGHDAIVVMGHTEKGRPSDSINNALGELYGYPKSWKDKTENMSRYRAENDTLMFDSIAPGLEGLGEKYGLDIDFEPIRTGQTGSDSMEEYKKKKDIEKLEDDSINRINKANISMQSSLLEKDEALKQSRSKLIEDKEGVLEDIQLLVESKDDLETDIAIFQKEREEWEKEKEKIQKERENMLKEKQELEKQKGDMQALANVSEGVILGVLKGDKKRQSAHDLIVSQGIESVTRANGKDKIINVVHGSLQDVIDRQRVPLQVSSRDMVQDEPTK